MGVEEKKGKETPTTFPSRDFSTRERRARSIRDKGERSRVTDMPRRRSGFPRLCTPRSMNYRDPRVRVLYCFTGDSYSFLRVLLFLISPRRFHQTWTRWFTTLFRLLFESDARKKKSKEKKEESRSFHLLSIDKYIQLGRVCHTRNNICVRTRLVVDGRKSWQ